jgi:curli biogenesis system outer membrane secretion channel CsgG
MNRRTLNLTGLAVALALPALAFAQAGAPPRVAVTDMAYTRNVAQYFEAGTVKSSGAIHANAYGMAATQQSSGTYVAGTYSYMEQRELGSFVNDIRGLMLKGGAFRLVQGKRFDDGGPQLTKAEQALNQIQTGKMAKPPARQPEVHDIIARIKKGEFPGADYVLFGTLSSLEFRDQLSPLQGTTSASYQFSLDLVADFSLINTKTYEIKAAFSAQGAGNDTKLLSNRGDIVRPNRGQVMRDTSQSLAANVYQQLADQLGLEQLPEAAPRGNANRPVTPPQETTTTLR